MLNTLKTLTELDGVSGDESAVRDFILDYLKDKNCDIRITNTGSVVARKKGKNRADRTVLLSAHMDEVGFIVSHITKDGYLRLSAVGGISPGVISGRRLRFKNGTKAVVGVKPVHHLEKDEREKQPPLKSLFADIGAKDREDAEKHVQPGDFCVFDSGFEYFGEGFIRGKAIDDRFGCAALMDILSGELEYDLCFAFVSMEEIGCIGAISAAYEVKPDIAVVIEATTACDIPGSKDEQRVCELGKGSVLSHKDGGAAYDLKLYRLAKETAAANNLKFQDKMMVCGGNDSRSYIGTASGSRIAAISVPCRYLHSQNNVVKRTDLLETRILAEKFAYACAAGRG